LSHHGISVVKGMLLKGQAFLSSNLKRTAIEYLDSASSEFVSLKLEIEALKSDKARLDGELSVVITENGELKREVQSLSEALQAKSMPLSDDAKLVPVVATDGTVVAVAEVVPEQT
jgi:FtsZ-binding cell division protein ZapB